MATGREIYGWFKDYFDRNEYPYTTDNDNYIISAGLSLNGKLESCNILIKCADDYAVIHGNINILVDEKLRVVVMDYLMRENLFINNGSFIIDLRDGEVRYALTLDCRERTSISDELIGSYFSFPGVMFDFCGDYLLAVISGQMSPKEAAEESLRRDAESCP